MSGRAHQAVAANDLNLLKRLVVSKESVVSSDVESDFKRVDVNCKSRKGYSLLYRACKLGRFEIAKFLLDNNAVYCESRIDERVKQLKQVYSSLVELNYQSQVNNAAFYRVMDAVNRTPIVTRERENPIHVAAQYGHAKIVQLIIDHTLRLLVEQQKLIDDMSAVVKEITRKVTASKMQKALEMARYLDISSSKTKENPTDNEDKGEFVSIGKNNRIILPDDDDVPQLDYISSLNKGSYTLSNIINEQSGNISPLLIACKHGRPEVVTVLLKAGSNVNQRWVENQTPLHLAVKNGNIEVVKVLLQQSDIQVNLTDVNGWSPICVAIAEKNKEVTKLLLEDSRTSLYVSTWKQDNLLHIAAKTKNARIFQIVLNGGLKRHLMDPSKKLDVSLINSKNCSGYRPIDIAIAHRYQKIIDYFDGFMKKQHDNLSPELKTFALTDNQNTLRNLVFKSVFETDLPLARELLAISPKLFNSRISSSFKYLYCPQAIRGRTPLEFCVRYGQLKMLDFLLIEKGAKLKGSCLLHVACKSNHVGILCRLLRDPKWKKMVDSVDIHNLTPLYYAVRSRNVRLVQHLLDAGADVNKHICKTKPPPFMLACINNQMEIVDMFLKKKVDVSNCKLEATGTTPLHRLATKETSQSMEIIKLLLVQDPHLINKTDIRANTPLHFAVKHASFDIADLLLQHNARLDVLNYNDMMPISYVFSRGLIRDLSVCGVVSTSIRQLWLDLYDKMIKKGQDVNLKMKGSVSLLHKLAQLGDLQMFKHLVENRKARLVNNLTYKGWSPLHVAIRYGRTDIVQYLIECGMNVNQPTTRLYPIHLALIYKHKASVELLLKANASVQVNDTNNQKPLHHAMRSVYSPIQQIILKGASVTDEDITGLTPIHSFLMTYGAQQISSALGFLENEPNDVYSALVTNYRHGTTILHQICKHGQVQNLLRALKLGMRGAVDQVARLRELLSIRERAKENWTPIMTAVYYSRISILRQIFTFIDNTLENARVEEKASFKAELINLPSGTSLYTAVHMSFWNNSSINSEIPPLLILQGGLLNNQDKYGRTSMHILCSRHDVTQETLLMYNALGMDLTICDFRYNANALLIFMLRRDKELVSYLIKQELINVNTPLNAAGDTMLHVACRTGNKRLLKWLLTLKADLRVQNESGYTPPQVAKKCLHKFLLGKMYHTSEKKAIQKQLRKETERFVTSGQTPQKETKNKPKRRKRTNHMKDLYFTL